MRLYETAFLIAPNLPEEEIEKIINDMAEVVSKQKGKMDNIDKATIRVRKLNPPLGGPIKSVGITMSRKQGE